jgi:hypothetical protein
MILASTMTIDNEEAEEEDVSTNSSTTNNNSEYPIISGVQTVFFQYNDTLEWVTCVQSRSVDRDRFKYEPHVLHYLRKMARELKGDVIDHFTAHNDRTIKLFTMLKVKAPPPKHSQIYDLATTGPNFRQ